MEPNIVVRCAYVNIIKCLIIIIISFQNMFKNIKKSSIFGAKLTFSHGRQIDIATQPLIDILLQDHWQSDDGFGLKSWNILL